MEEKELLDLIKEGGKLIVDVWMDNCTFCEQYAPVFDKVSSDNPHFNMVKFKLPAASAGSSVFKKNYMKSENGERIAAPATMIFENGELTARKYGLISEEELLELIHTGKIDPTQKIVAELKHLYMIKGEIVTMSEQLPGLNKRIDELRKQLEQVSR